MIKYFFYIVLLFHATIHLIGFIRSVKPDVIPDLSKEVGLLCGIFWLLSALLVLVTAVFYMKHLTYWPFVGLVGIFLSQMLIVLYWNDAKYGTLVNVLVLLLAVPALGDYYFSRKIQKEQMAFIDHFNEPAPRFITSEDLQHLPNVVQRWLHVSGVIGHESITSVRLKQKGQMKLKPDGSWMEFSATQYFNVVSPGFIWNTKVDAMPLMYFTGRDFFFQGEGKMQIKLLSLLNVVNVNPNHKLNTGALLRYMGEMCWFPTAALREYINWEELDDCSVMATIRLGELEESGIYTFGPSGDLVSFEAARYFGGEAAAQKETWLVEVVDYKTSGEFRIPYKCKVTWKLKSGDFHWLNLDITDIQYNHPGLFPFLQAEHPLVN